MQAHDVQYTPDPVCRCRASANLPPVLSSTSSPVLQASATNRVHALQLCYAQCTMSTPEPEPVLSRPEGTYLVIVISFLLGMPVYTRCQ